MILYSLLPIYIFGNLHCASMCGPLVMLIGRSPHAWLYFVGRLLSFSLAGGLAASLGLLFNVSSIASYLSLCLGMGITFLGLLLLLRLDYPGHRFLAQKTAKISAFLGNWVAQKRPAALFWFGFFTILLPCGQTVVVFSACALQSSMLVGLVNGALFATLTSPALIAMMRAHFLFVRLRSHYRLVMGLSVMLVGLLATLRALADFQLISHLSFSPIDSCHIVLF